MWIPGDFLVSPRKLTAVLAKEAQANGVCFSCINLRSFWLCALSLGIYRCLDCAF